jgi:hypothetical protein
MPSRQSTESEAALFDDLLQKIKTMIEEAAHNDPILLFSLRRRIYKRLEYWERKTPAERKKLKKLKWEEQNGCCAICRNSLELHGAELDRLDSILGYTCENTRLVHHNCHRQDQANKRYK